MENSRKRAATLYSVTFLLAVLVWYALLHDPAYQAILRRISLFSSPPPKISLPDSTLYEAKDPALNTPFPDTGIAAEIRSKTPPNPKGYLIAAMGDCASCTMLDLAKIYSQTRERQITLLAFASGETEKVKSLAAAFRREGIEIPFYLDAGSKLSTALNSYYPGRLYYYTSDWKLRWRERDMAIDNYLFRTGRFDRIMENTKP